MKRFDVAVSLFHEHAAVFACPVCADAMRVQQAQQPSLACAAGHAFDFARQGYVNLLLSHQKHSQQPGYDLETLRARKAMLETGFFDPLAAQLVAYLREVQDALAPRPDPLPVLDAGTGEGFVFAKAITDFLPFSQQRLSAVGTDISKPAIQLACQLDAPVMWCVANLMKQLPFATDAFAVLMNILAPANADEYRRVLRHDGYLIKVLPLEQHLAEIRQAIYERERKDSTSNAMTTLELTQHFDLLATHVLGYQRPIGKALTDNLLHMSPLFWKGKKERIAQTIQDGLPHVTVHLSVTLWRKR
jgi:23S rRNA (guanine745-N1)-methyltransferase